MSDESRFAAQQLSSAKYFVAAQAAEAEATQATAAEAADLAPAAEVRGSTDSPENMYRWINAGVAAVLLVIGGVWYWHHQSTVKSTADTFRKRTGNPLDIVLWIGGSEHTVDEVVTEMQRQTQAEFTLPNPVAAPIDFTQHWQNFNPKWQTYNPSWQGSNLPHNGSGS